MRKKVDDRIRTLVDNGVKLGHRTLLVVIGDNGRDQVVNLHYMLSKLTVKARPSVLWCYKKELYLSSHKRKRLKQIKRLASRGLLDAASEDPFSLFMSCTNIRYCYYNETHTILGNTYGMAVLQDFEALTPNLLARTVETVQGGGLIVLLLSRLDSLTQLYTLVMDCHARLRSNVHGEVTGRFNERLVLSLTQCNSALLLDDELNVLPTSKSIKHIKKVELNEDGEVVNRPGMRNAQQLKELVTDMADTKPIGVLLDCCKTLDQARAVMTCMDVATDRSARAIVALTAARGRGKSAAMGLCIAGAISIGYSNICITSPVLDNTDTLFQFVVKGLQALGYQEHSDYDISQSAADKPPPHAQDNKHNRKVMRINVYREHRQTVQWVHPSHAGSLNHIELLVIDEAAAIPLPTVTQLLGPYMVLLGSTINGYEGTGRSLSLKLLQQLKTGKHKGQTTTSGLSVSNFQQINMEEPIRYTQGDQCEAWLNSLLCLEASQHIPQLPTPLPHPSSCSLYHVQRDTLFSYHKAAEHFLQSMVSLYVSSHYKNTPNDLLLLADAPAHMLFVLIPPVQQDTDELPPILAVIQVALEGKISREHARSALAAGQIPSGDLVPWVLAQQFQENNFPALSGARIVRIAVHPNAQRAGYGAHAMACLQDWLTGNLVGVKLNEDEGNSDQESEEQTKATPEKTQTNGKSSDFVGLQNEVLEPQALSKLPPLLQHLADRPPPDIDYLCVSYGLTYDLLKFWRMCGMRPLYLRQTANETTGEFTCIMIKLLQPAFNSDNSEQGSSSSWLDQFEKDFQCRILSLLPGPFKSLDPALVLCLLDAQLSYPTDTSHVQHTQAEQKAKDPSYNYVTPYDMARLKAYTNQVVDHHMITDILPNIAKNYFLKHTPVTLSVSQAAILLAMGLQLNSVDAICKTLGIGPSQVLHLHQKTIRKVVEYLYSQTHKEVDSTLPRLDPSILAKLKPHSRSIDDDLAQNNLNSNILSLPAEQIDGADTNVQGSSKNSTPAKQRPAGKKRSMSSSNSKSKKKSK